MVAAVYRFYRGYRGKCQPHILFKFPQMLVRIRAYAELLKETAFEIVHRLFIHTCYIYEYHFGTARYACTFICECTSAVNE